MNYEDLIALKEAGYPQGGNISMGTDNRIVEHPPNDTQPAVPTVAMLIVMSRKFQSLTRDESGFLVNGEYRGDRLENALLKLWLANPPVL